MNMDLLNAVRAQLTTPRSMRAKVASTISTTLSVTDPIAGLSEDRLATMEEYEQELLLAPLFTPGMEERVELEPHLPGSGLSLDETNDLVTTLAKEQLSCPLSFGQEEGILALPEVVLERFVRLLNLECQIDPGVAERLNRLVKSEERHRAFAQARRRVWQNKRNIALLTEALTAMEENNAYQTDKLIFLSDFVRGYRPTTLSSLVEQLENLVDSYQKDEEHPVFDEQLAHYQSKAIASRHTGNQIKAFRLAMAHSFLADLRK
ncbi:MAG: hypothetical protein HQL52_10845 [Magnetococcales bacterium]|nr:hypothetical protein [Magnetococcales bacterium]